MTLVKQNAFLWWFPLLITLIILPFTPWIDMAIEQHFFSTGKDPITHFHESPLLDFIFTYGPLSSEIVSIGALFFIPFARYRNQALVLVMTMVIGSGLIAHLLLKEFWGRPRPRQVIELGGAQPYRAVWQPNFHPQEPSKSFVCGHCTMGFYFFAFVLLGRRYQKKIMDRLRMDSLPDYRPCACHHEDDAGRPLFFRCLLRSYCHVVWRSHFRLARLCSLRGP